MTDRAAPAPAHMRAPLGEWRCLAHARRPNGLVIGPEALVVRTLEVCGNWLRQPVVHWPRDGAPWRGTRQVSTLVLHEVGALGPQDQAALLQWMGGAGCGVQIVSLASSNVFPLVQQGAFLEALYYRLNYVVIEVASHALAPDETIASPQP